MGPTSDSDATKRPVEVKILIDSPGLERQKSD